MVLVTGLKQLLFTFANLRDLKASDSVSFYMLKSFKTQRKGFKADFSPLPPQAAIIDQIYRVQNLLICCIIPCHSTLLGKMPNTALRNGDVKPQIHNHTSGAIPIAASPQYSTTVDDFLNLGLVHVEVFVQRPLSQKV